ncbi:hypothetical protein [Metallosphaera sp.]|uniref:hypothetical protein n=1 Tax=Metallosphaera sp. TaxID=2020860 RepID=UPI003180E29D
MPFIARSSIKKSVEEERQVEEHNVKQGEEKKPDCSQMMIHYATLVDNLIEDIEQLLKLLNDRSIKEKPRFNCLDYDFYQINPLITRYMVKGLKEECKKV